MVTLLDHSKERGNTVKKAMDDMSWDKAGETAPGGEITAKHVELYRTQLLNLDINQSNHKQKDMSMGKQFLKVEDIGKLFDMNKRWVYR
jgi:hypothetical protein